MLVFLYFSFLSCFSIKSSTLLLHADAYLLLLNSLSTLKQQQQKSSTSVSITMNESSCRLAEVNWVSICTSCKEDNKTVKTLQDSCTVLQLVDKTSMQWLSNKSEESFTHTSVRGTKLLGLWAELKIFHVSAETWERRKPALK